MELCCDCAHCKKEKRHKNYNPTGLYCEITEWSVGIVSVCTCKGAYKAKSPK